MTLSLGRGTWRHMQKATANPSFPVSPFPRNTHLSCLFFFLFFFFFNSFPKSIGASFIITSFGGSTSNCSFVYGMGAFLLSTSGAFGTHPSVFRSKTSPLLIRSTYIWSTSMQEHILFLLAYRGAAPFHSIHREVRLMSRGGCSKERIYMHLMIRYHGLLCVCVCVREREKERERRRNTMARRAKGERACRR